MTSTGRWANTRVLLVDDEESDRLLVMRALRRFRPEAVDGGEAALGWIDENGLPEVIVTDQFMRGMDGLELLAELRERHPAVVRVLLTGHADLQLALDSVNAGQVFQLLQKDWPQARWVRGVEAALRQAELLRTERELIESTLAGAVSALSEALALANPVALGHTLRVEKLCVALASALAVAVARPWEVKMGAQLSQLGSVQIPAGVLERALLGRTLKDWEQELYDGAPARAAEILKELPRLDGVRDIIRWQRARYDGRTRGAPKGEDLPIGARILRVAVDADRLEMSGANPQAVLSTLNRRRGHYDPAVLAVLGDVLADAKAPRGFKRKTVAMNRLVVGMVFAQDVITHRGLLLTAKGSSATPALLERIRGFGLAHGIQDEVEMFVPIAD